METFVHYGKVARFDDRVLYLDGDLIGEFKGLKEAKEFLESIRISAELVEELKQQKQATTLLEEDVALALYESGETRVTESLVRGMKQLVEERRFFPSEVVLKLRENNIDTRFNNKIDYVLNDGTTVYIDIETNKTLNTILDLRESTELLRFMTSNQKNFIRCVQDLLEDN